MTDECEHLLTREEKWDFRFLEMASFVASWSKDPSTKCGAVIVRPDMTICSVGYNGFPRQISDAQALLEDREQKYARVIHAEMNAILHARERLDGYTIYIVGGAILPSCERCAAHIIQSGIKIVVTPLPDEEDPGYIRWRDNVELAKIMYLEAGVELRQRLYE